jgi:hypothetical protein
VLVGIVNNDPNDTCLIQVSEAQAVIVSVGETVMKVDEAGVVVNGGANGGVVKVDALVQELAKVTTFMTTLRTAFSAAVPVPGDGGAAVKAAIMTALQPLQLPEYTSIADEKLKH